MKSSIRRNVVLVASLAFVAVLSWADSHQDYGKMMKQAAAACTAVKKNLDGKDAVEAAKAATQLKGHFKEIEAFWKDKGAADAVQFSQKAQEAAGKIAGAASSGDLDGANAGFQSLVGNCQGCHEAHREKLPDGSFKIK
jgi:hypothetical protein